MRMMRFQFTISHVPGKELTIADALSRAPACTPSERDELLQLETTAYVDFVIRHLPATEQRITEIRECQEADEVLQQIEEYCRSGWQEKSSLPPELKPYYPVAAELTVQNGLILRGGRMVRPYWSSGDHKLPREGETVGLVAGTHKAVGGARSLLRRLSKIAETETPTSQSYSTT